METNSVTRSDGGPAFPRTGFEVDRHENSPSDTKPQDGMSLRDYFAAQVLPAVYHHAMEVGCEDQDTIAAEAYELADTMIEMRAKGGA